MSESKKENKPLPPYEPSITSILNPQHQEHKSLKILPLQDNDGPSSDVDQNPLISFQTSSSELNEATLKVCVTNFLMLFNAPSPPIIRYLFRQIAGEVSKLHLNEAYHGDLSLENVFLDEEYKVSLGPKGPTREHFLDGVGSDLTALGEILFALCFGSLPYVSLEDERYIASENGDWELFWALNEEILKLEKRGLNFAKSGLKDLISKFLSGKAESKFDLVQLLSHEWMNGMAHTSMQVKSLLSEVQKKMKKIS